MKEVQRAKVISNYLNHYISSAQAAQTLNLSSRQFWRLLARFRSQGDIGLAHRNRGKPSPKKITKEMEVNIISLRNSKYLNFNDLHFTEKLNELEGLSISREKVRQILRYAGIPPKHSHRSPKHRSRREPSPQAGVMLQIDASHHHWLENRNTALSLIAAIDDATNQIIYAHFELQETSFSYLRMLRFIAKSKGLPVSLYADRHSIFITSRQPTIDEQLQNQHPLTQLGRALFELGITYIPANSPQAKGRVERLFKTLQDRLVSELRLANISSIEDANKFLSQFIKQFNLKFSRPPKNSQSAWRPLPHNLNLDSILCLKETRTVKSDNTISLHGTTLQIPPNPNIKSFAKAKVHTHQLINGQINIFYHDQLIAHFSANIIHQRRHLSSPLKPGQKVSKNLTSKVKSLVA